MERLQLYQESIISKISAQVFWLFPHSFQIVPFTCLFVYVYLSSICVSVYMQALGFTLGSGAATPDPSLLHHGLWG